MAAQGNWFNGIAPAFAFRLAGLGAILAALAAVCTAARAEDQYPSKSVRIVVPFAAGGPTDIVGRIVGSKLGELLGQQFYVENKTGAGGNLGADAVAKSAPDGYTLLVATVSTHAINPGLYSRMPYDPIRDFAPIAQVGVTPSLLGVHPSLPVKDVQGRSRWSGTIRGNPAAAHPVLARSFICWASSSRRRAACKSRIFPIAVRRR